ncbi:MAG: MFS transporter, partial [Candidatus Pacearchaeota archaeon]|nr:MFS transporter [Candidatus Pacearchaeota archaeon]
MKFFNNYLKKKEGKKIYLIAVIGVFTGLSLSFIDTVWALYIDSFVESAFWVGLITALITAITFLSYFFVIPLVERKDKVRLYSLSLGVAFLSYVLFAFTSSLILLILILIPSAFFSALRITSFGLVVKDSSCSKNLSKNLGLLYALENVSWVIGPLVAGYILSAYGFSVVFFIAALILLFVFSILNLSKIKDVEVKKRVDGHFLKNFFYFFKKKD